MKWWIGPLTLVTFVAVGIGVGSWRDNNSVEKSTQVNQIFNPIESGTYLTTPKLMPAFKLIDANGEPFTENNLRDRWSFIFFGYTSCPEICPKTLGIMQQIAEILGPNSQTRFILISIDPKHDTPEVLKKYFKNSSYSNLPFIGATGETNELMNLTKTLGIHLQEETPIGEHIEHSGSLLLINPQGEFIALFSQTQDAKVIARDFQKVMQLYIQSTS